MALINHRYQNSMGEGLVMLVLILGALVLVENDHTHDQYFALPYPINEALKDVV